jgi:hypothetical protein
MLDVGLFKNLRFTAASGAVSVAFFALSGFIFLVTQYFQFLKGYSPLSTGVRLLPVAGTVAVSSVAGTRLAVRLGNKVIVTSGLVLLSGAFVWISTVSVASTYLEIAAQMLVLGAGLGSIGAGLIQASAGESTDASKILTIIGPTVITLWLLVMGVLLLRNNGERPAATM